jgi:hypothetical protein
MRIYSFTADYPVDRIMLAVNRSRVQHTMVQTHPHWFDLEASPPSLRHEVNELAIDPPVFLSVRQVTPDTPDQRYLAVALANIAFLA